MVVKSALGSKGHHEASPADVLPYIVFRRYGDPKLVKRLSGVRKLLLGDCAEMAKRAALIGSANDRQRITELRAEIEKTLVDDVDLPQTFDVLIDEHTSLRYVVTVADRRQ